MIAAGLATLGSLCLSATLWRLAKPTSFSIALSVSLASVGWAIAFGCPVVSTATRSRS
jgi:hypothetical protein